MERDGERQRNRRKRGKTANSKKLIATLRIVLNGDLKTVERIIFNLRIKITPKLSTTDSKRPFTSIWWNVVYMKMTGYLSKMIINQFKDRLQHSVEILVLYIKIPCWCKKPSSIWRIRNHLKMGSSWVE